jgi:hypothetical protein
VEIRRDHGPSLFEKSSVHAQSPFLPTVLRHIALPAILQATSIIAVSSVLFGDFFHGTISLGKKGIG